MARYTSSFIVAVSIEQLHYLLLDILQSCDLDVIYDTNEYIMARERPGQVSFSKLVTVEVLIDKAVTSDTQSRLNLVVKNDELPLQFENHCYQISQLVNQALIENRNWQLIESVAG